MERTKRSFLHNHTLASPERNEPKPVSSNLYEEEKIDRQVEVNQKTVKCRDLEETGYCFKAEKCNFSHGDTEAHLLLTTKGKPFWFFNH